MGSGTLQDVFLLHLVLMATGGWTPEDLMPCY